MARQTNSICFAAGVLALLAAPAMAQNYDYLSRSDTISLTAGNAKDSNLVIQTPTPWPWYVKRVTIPGSGARGSDLMKSYQTKFANKPAASPFPSITITAPNQ